MGIGLLAAVFIFLAIATASAWALSVRQRPVDVRARALTGGRPMPGRDLSLPIGQRVLVPALEGLTQLMVALLPPAFIARTARRLVVAGRPMTVQGFLAAALILGTVSASFCLLLVWKMSGGAPSALALIAVLVFAVLGAAFPFLWLWRKAGRRQVTIWRSLPDAFDLITICVEAGLGLDAAFHRVAERLKGPFADEITQMLREVGMGRPRREALVDLASRTDVDDLQTFVQAVVQAEQLGTSLGRTLRTQAHRLRVKRRQRAEEMARQAPVKMVFPLVLCLLPSVFVVILGPVALTVIDALRQAL